MTDHEIHEWALHEGDPAEKVQVTIRRGDQVRRIECSTVIVFGTSLESDRTWQFVSGNIELIGRLVCSAVQLFVNMGELSTALAVNLVRNLPATMESIGSGLSQHASWRAQHGEAERPTPDDAGGEDRPGTRGP